MPLWSSTVPFPGTWQTRRCSRQPSLRQSSSMLMQDMTSQCSCQFPKPLFRDHIPLSSTDLGCLVKRILLRLTTCRKNGQEFAFPPLPFLWSVIRLTVAWIMIIRRMAPSMLRQLKSAFLTPAFCSSWSHLGQFNFDLSNILHERPPWANYSRSVSLWSYSEYRGDWSAETASQGWLLKRCWWRLEHFISSTITWYDMFPSHFLRFASSL
jgi:hypothetical protein